MRSHRTECSSHPAVVVALAVIFSLPAIARAADPVADPFAGAPAEGAAATPPAPPAEGAAAKPALANEPSSAPATAPPKWEPGVSVEQLPAGAYPEALADGGIFGLSLTLRKPTRGLWGGSLWMTFHGLQWPYMPKTGVGVSGYAWIDTGYEEVLRPHDMQRTDRKFWLQQGRGLLRLTPTYTRGSFFVQAQVEVVANKDQAASPPLGNTDDLWVRVGNWNRWDIQLGRFESWEVYHLGMGLDLNTLERNGATDFGQFNDKAPLYLVRFSPETRESGVGYAALHLYPFGFLRLELLTLAGNDNNGFNTLGERPAVILDFGMIKLNFAGEYIKRRGRDNYNDPMTMTQVESRNTVFQRGFGGGIQFIFDPWVEAGFNVSKGIQDATTQDNVGTIDKGGSFDILSLGGFINARIVEDWLVGAGVDFTKKEDINFLVIAGDPNMALKAGYFDQVQAFGAVQYAVAKRLFIKAVGGYARATFSPAGVPTNMDIVNTMYSGRIRFLYLF